MSLIKIKFLQAGKWADHPKDPIFEVEEGEVKEVSVDLAKVATEAGKAEFIQAKPEPEPEKEQKPETGPVPKAERTKPGPKPKAEKRHN